MEGPTATSHADPQKIFDVDIAHASVEQLQMLHTQLFNATCDVSDELFARLSSSTEKCSHSNSVIRSSSNSSRLQPKAFLLKYKPYFQLLTVLVFLCAGFVFQSCKMGQLEKRMDTMLQEIQLTRTSLADFKHMHFCTPKEITLKQFYSSFDYGLSTLGWKSWRGGS